MCLSKFEWAAWFVKGKPEGGVVLSLRLRLIRTNAVSYTTPYEFIRSSHKSDGMTNLVPIAYHYIYILSICAYAMWFCESSHC